MWCIVCIVLYLSVASKNSIKTDIKDGFYHVYNRGVGKMDIFKDEIDYGVFLSYLKECLSPPADKKDLLHEINVQGGILYVPKRVPENYFKSVNLCCYCLMPNHIHFIVKQLGNGLMRKFMKSVFTRYSMYFNKKYKRVGPVFQGRYKGVCIDNDAYLLYLSKYIHLNPLKDTKGLTKAKSSYADYLGLKNTPWLHKELILQYFNNKVLIDFKKANNYKKFVEGDSKDLKIISDLTLEK